MIKDGRTSTGIVHGTLPWLHGFHGYVVSLYQEDFIDWWAGRIFRQVNGSIERSCS